MDVHAVDEVVSVRKALRWCGLAGISLMQYGCAVPGRVEPRCADAPWLAPERLLPRLAHELRCLGLNPGDPLDHYVDVNGTEVFILANYAHRIETVYFRFSCDGRELNIQWDAADEFISWEGAGLEPSKCPAGDQ